MIAILATVVTETVWLYPILGIVGFIFNQNESPIPLAVVAVFIGLGVVAGRLVAIWVEDESARAPIQALIGLAVIYLIMAALANPGGYDPFWGPRLIGGGFPGRTMAGLIVGTMAAAVLWFRGTRIAAEIHPEYRLRQSFRMGIVALAVAILAEQASGREFHATAMLVPLFVVSLAGLAFARLPPGGMWARVVGLAVALVVGGGMVLGAIGAVVGGRGLELLAIGWHYFIEGTAWLVNFLLAPLLELFFLLIDWIRGGEDPWKGKGLPRLEKFSWWDRIDPSNTPPFLDVIIQFLKYPAMLIFIYLLYRMLVWGHRQYFARGRAATIADRESTRGDANVTADLIRLALSLTPDWMRPKPRRAGPSYAADLPGISEVYALYFDMLRAAAAQGYAFSPALTPGEQREHVQAVLPDTPVDQITDRFNEARYGNIPSSPEAVARLRQRFETTVG